MPVEFETVKGDTVYREMMAYCFSPRFAALYQIESLSISVLEAILDLVILVNLKTTIAVPKKVGNGERWQPSSLSLLRLGRCAISATGSESTIQRKRPPLRV